MISICLSPSSAVIGLPVCILSPAVVSQCPSVSCKGAHSTQRHSCLGPNESGRPHPTSEPVPVHLTDDTTSSDESTTSCPRPALVASSTQTQPSTESRSGFHQRPCLTDASSVRQTLSSSSPPFPTTSTLHWPRSPRLVRRPTVSSRAKPPPVPPWHDHERPRVSLEVYQKSKQESEPSTERTDVPATRPSQARR